MGTTPNQICSNHPRKYHDSPAVSSSMGGEEGSKLRKRTFKVQDSKQTQPLGNGTSQTDYMELHSAMLQSSCPEVGSNGTHIDLHQRISQKDWD